MDSEFFYRLIKLTLLLASFISIGIFFFQDFSSALAFLIGASWGCLNLVLIKYLLESFLVPSKRNFLKFLVLLGIKFPILYFLGYALLMTDFLPLWHTLLGFTLIFVTIAMGSFGLLMNIRKEQNTHGT